MASFRWCEFYLNKDRASQDHPILYFGIKGTLPSLASKILMNDNSHKSESPRDIGWVLRTQGFPLSTHLISTATIRDWDHCCPHFTDEETEAQKHWVTCQSHTAQ